MAASTRMPMSTLFLTIFYRTLYVCYELIPPKYPEFVKNFHFSKKNPVCILKKSWYILHAKFETAE